MNVIVAMETSGVVREAFRARGHDAISVDLLPSQADSSHHVQGDVFEVLRERAGWADLLIAHPTCTYLCNSGAGRMVHTPPNPSPGVLYGPERFVAMLEAANVFARLLLADVPRIAVENPTMHGSARAAIAAITGHMIAEPAQAIQPFQFGDDASKRTVLHLIGLPLLVTLPVADWYPPRWVTSKDGRTRPRWSNQTDSGQNKLTPSAR